MKRHPMPCQDRTEVICDYVDGKLQGESLSSLENHLRDCKDCQGAVERNRVVRQLLKADFERNTMSKDFAEKTGQRIKVMISDPSKKSLPSRGEEDDEYPQNEPVASEGVLLGVLTDRFGAAPWWVISMCFHGLAILLLGLLTMALKTAQHDELILVTNLTKTVDQPVEKPPDPPTARDVLESQTNVEPTVQDSTEQSNIVVPLDILAKAELGDHFETINLDRPDTQSAYGNPDARMFHSVQGNDEPEGGGGTGGLSLADDLIGVGGSSSPGSGGGWGGGKGTGIGIGTGSGKGSYGQRSGGGRRLMVMRHGGSKQTESSVDKALEWLAKHQEADGSWNAWKYEARQDGRTQGVNGDAAVTGYALLAFLGAGHTSKIGKYKDNVRRGLDWMVKTLDETEKANGRGRYCNNHGSNYTQGVATLALAEAAAMCRDPRIQDAAQRAIDGVVFGQRKKGESEYEAWGYDPKAGINDTSVTGWNVMALKSAKVAGLQVDPACYEGAMRWIIAGQELENAPQGGDAAYWEGGMMWYQGTATPKSRTGHKNMALTSAASLTRLLVGGERPEAAGIAGPANLMKKPENLPTADVGRFNLYYWYYGTLTMFQVGGEHWKLWNEAMKPVLVNSQRKDGDFDGSWDPLFSEAQGHIYGGRVMSTALAAMCLEVYYRYLPVYR